MKIKALLFFMLFNAIVYGQFKTDLSPMVNFHSSNSTTLGQFGDVPVSLYTGTANVSVPIHKLNERGVELDISLQYNTKGVRVEDVPGWVGQNWALNAGGVITRSIRGTSFDELNFFHNKNIAAPVTVTPYLAEWPTSVGGAWYYHVFQRGYFYHTSKLNSPNWNNAAHLNDLAYDSYLNYSAGLMETLRMQNWRMDLEPDLFTFNFMGHSGHFFLGQDGEWKVFSDSNLKVVCNLDTDISFPVPAVPEQGPNTVNPFMIRFPKVIDKITLIDDKGNKYLFNQVELTFNSLTANRPPINYDSRCISSAFYITKVTDINNNVLYEFEYEKGPWQGKFSVSYDHSMLKVDDGNVVSNTATTSYNINGDWHAVGFGAPGQLILPSYLKKIKSESGIEIDFTSELVQNALKYTRGGNSLFDNRSETYYGANRFGMTDFYFLDKEVDMVTDCSPAHRALPLWDKIKNKKLTKIKIKDNSNNVVDVNLDYIDQTSLRLFLTGLTFNGTKKYKFDYNGYYLPNFLDVSTDRLGYYNFKQFKFTTQPYDYNYWLNELPVLRETTEYVHTGSLNKITYPTGGYTAFEFEPHTYSKKLNGSNQLIADNGIIGGLRIKKITNHFDNSIETKEYFYKKSLTDNTSSGNLIYNPIYIKDSGAIVYPIGNPNDSGKKLFNRSLNTLTSMSNFMGVQLEYTDVIEKVSGNGYIHYKFSNYEEFPDINAVSLHSAALPFVPKTDRSYERGSLKEKLVYSENNTLLQKNEYKYYAQNSLMVNAVNINFNYNIGCLGCMSGPLGSTYYLLAFTSAYQIPYSDKFLVEEINQNYNQDGSMLYSLKTNRYVRYPQDNGTSPIINYGSVFKKEEYTLSSEQNFGILKTYQYPFELNTILGNTMISKNVLPVIGETTVKVQGDPLDPHSSENLSERKLDYQTVYNASIADYTPLPKESFIKKGNNNFEKEFIYTNYDSKGNIIEYKKEEGIPVSVIWGYNSTKPIAILENVTYQSISQGVLADLLLKSDQDVDNGTNGLTENTLRSALNNLRTAFPDAMIKTYTYDPLSGITSGTDSRGDTTYHIYDEMQRLKEVRDKNGNILSEYKYHYKNN